MIKGLQKYQRSKFEVNEKLLNQPDSILMWPGPGWSSRFFSTSNFDLWYFCSLLTYKNVQYLIWKIWFISVLRVKAKAMVWLLTWFMIAQSNLISYHTEAFVKTESACTVKRKKAMIFYIRHTRLLYLKYKNPASLSILYGAHCMLSWFYNIFFKPQCILTY